jgi:hypothetical protein
MSFFQDVISLARQVRINGDFTAGITWTLFNELLIIHTIPFLIFWFISTMLSHMHR